MHHCCKNCNHKCHCRFESYPTYPHKRYHSYINPCQNKTIDDASYMQQYAYPNEIKTYYGSKYYLSYKEENKIIRIDESDYIEVTHANNLIDQVQLSAYVEYHEQKIPGCVGSKPIECKTKMPVSVPTTRDVYVPTKGTVVKKVAIYLHIIDACKCRHCDCGAAKEEQERQLIEHADRTPKHLEDQYCCCVIL